MKIIKFITEIFLSASLFFFSCKAKDSDVQAKIVEKFSATPELVEASAMVTDGVATLSGQVKDSSEKTQAENLAKDVKGVKSVINKIMVMPREVAAPAISPDKALETGVIDATKDFPGVTATVHEGEITLTGSIKRSELTTLMQSLNTLKPKKINNQLTIK